VVLAVLVAVRPPERVPPAMTRTSMLSDAAEGVRLVLADPSLSAPLVATGLVAAFVLPMTSVCIPLLARERGWTSAAAGLVVGATACGGLAVSLLVARRGTLGRPGLAAGVGPLVASLGMAGVAVSSTVAWSITAAALSGIGIGLFVSHMAPLVMAAAPDSHQARVQSLLGLVQTIPLLASTNGIAAVAGHMGTTIAVLCCAAGTAAAGVHLMARSHVRVATLHPAPVGSAPRRS
jgi:Major Facilitator Superfamily